VSSARPPDQHAGRPDDAQARLSRLSLDRGTGFWGTALEHARRMGDRADELTEDEKRATVVRLAFGGDRTRFDTFCDTVRQAVPDGTAAVLRGSAVTGVRWKDGAPFDADGPGTSDLDLTLVGDEALGLFTLTGFYVPGVHSIPLSDRHPDVAPALVPLRQQLMRMVRRPVNVQATRDFVMYVRGELIGQPYLTLFGHTGE
jgi:hypothetical protein